jgi:hypothetical protein
MRRAASSSSPVSLLFFSFVLNSIEESFTVITKSSETKERAGKSCCLCYLDRTKLEQSRIFFISLLLWQKILLQFR